MIFKKRGFTLLELQMASVLMVGVLIATGVIFYFALASIRYMHDAFMVYSNASAAMKALTDEIMVSNCYGSRQGGAPFATPEYSFYDNAFGYIHGSNTNFTNPSPPVGLSGETAGSCLDDMPFYNSGSGGNSVIYLRQPSQDRGNPTVAGDFPDHDIVGIYMYQNPVTGIDELKLEVADGGGPITAAGGDFTVAHHITELQWNDIAYNCVAVRIKAQGDVLSPVPDDEGDFETYKVTLGKMITLRCAPTIRPWE